MNVTYKMDIIYTSAFKTNMGIYNMGKIYKYRKSRL